MLPDINTDVLQSFSEGDNKAYFQLYNQLHVPVFRFCLHFVKDKDIANDIAHDVFVGLYEAKEKIRTDLSFRSYLYAIVKNKISDFYRKASQEESLREKIWEQIQQKQSETEDILVNAEYNDHLQKALDSLSPQKKLIFELSRNEQKTYQEIADNLGLSKNTVRNHIAETTKYLKNYLLAEADIVVTMAIILSLII
jgi:RNA polymerase sigma-70 factor, ECF subfamily